MIIPMAKLDIISSEYTVMTSYLLKFMIVI